MRKQKDFIKLYSWPHKQLHNAHQTFCIMGIRF